MLSAFIYYNLTFSHKKDSSKQREVLLNEIDNDKPMTKMASKDCQKWQEIGVEFARVLTV